MLALLRQFCYTWKTPVKIQLIKTFVLPIIQYAAPLMVAACSKSLANSSIEECQQQAQRIKRGCLAAQWDALDGIAAIGHSFILGIKVYSSLAAQSQQSRWPQQERSNRRYNV